MRFWPISVVVLVAMSCPAEDAPQPAPAAAKITTSDKHLGPQPILIAGVETGVVSEYIRRGEKFLGPGLSSRVFFERRFEGGFALRGNIAPFFAFRGRDLGETIFDLALAADNQNWLAGGTALLGYTNYARNTTPTNPAFVGSGTQEVYAGLELTGPGRPWAYVRYDFDKGIGRRSKPGAYFVAGANHRVPINRDMGFELAGRVGVDFGRGVNGFNDAQLTTKLDLRLARGLTLSPTLDWWFPAGKVWRQASGFRLVPSLGLRYDVAF